MSSLLERLDSVSFPAINRQQLDTVQVNVGYRCNQACHHCHVDAGPKRREEMNRETAQQVLRFLEMSGASAFDITGGAPELNRNFRFLVEGATRLGTRVMDRCNLTILQEPGQEDLGEFLAAHRVEIIASLPCYTSINVEQQRGKGVFARSIAGLKTLNAVGYGIPDSGLLLNLVYNPVGPSLPPPQQQLEADYKRELLDNYGICFNKLYTLCNVPINRFAHMLIKNGQLDQYLTTLKSSHRHDNLDRVMCRSLVSIDWQGYVYDCDFNQMLGLPMQYNGYKRRHVSELVEVPLIGNPITVKGHCYACTAGQGSSCGGALS
jgi:radical SAM/Cys-rich protein